MIDTDILSEYPLSPFDELHVEGDALWVEGVGWLGQYHSYLDSLWEKNLPYFVRDVYLNQLQTMGATPTLVRKLNMLNSKIAAYEMPTTSVSAMRASRWADEDDWSEPKKPARCISTLRPVTAPQEVNRFTPLSEPVHALPSEPTSDQTLAASSQPLPDQQVSVPAKKPASRKRKETPASQP